MGSRNNRALRYSDKVHFRFVHFSVPLALCTLIASGAGCRWASPRSDECVRPSTLGRSSPDGGDAVGGRARARVHCVCRHRVQQGVGEAGVKQE